MQDTDTWREKNQGWCLNGQVAPGGLQGAVSPGNHGDSCRTRWNLPASHPTEGGGVGVTSHSHPPWWSAAPGDAQSLNVEGGVVGMWKVPLSPGEPGDPQVIQK